MTQRITHWIAGGTHDGGNHRSADVFDPATGRVTAQVDLADAATVDRAVQSAAAAARDWRNWSMTRRGRVLFAFRELLSERKDDLAKLITAEHGKVVSDALGEVARGLEVVEFACGIPHLLKGSFSEGVSSGVDAYSIRQPVGVSVIISPFNFPAMVPMWFFPIAIACGNAVILKPSEKTPSAAMWMAELWEEAGLPPGVFSVVNGDKEVVQSLLTHSSVGSISFVGSTTVAQEIYATAAKSGKRAQALGGAKNHMVVLPDADLDLAADAAVSAGFGSAGERCMAISAVVAVGDVQDELVAAIADRAFRIRVGDGRRDNNMGPLITEQHQIRVENFLDEGTQDGAELIVDGRKLGHIDGDENGFWLGPSLFDRVTTSMSIYKEEIFGPVLCVIRVETFEEAIDLVNANPYGNGTAIFTNSGAHARRFQYEIEVGMVGINVPIPVPMAYYSFGGWKASLFGDAHAHGTEGVNFFTRGKAVTVRWPTNDLGGLSLGFPQHD